MDFTFAELAVSSLGSCYILLVNFRENELSTAFRNVSDNFSSIEVPIWCAKKHTEAKNNNIRSIKMF